MTEKREKRLSGTVLTWRFKTSNKKDVSRFASIIVMLPLISLFILVHGAAFDPCMAQTAPAIEKKIAVLPFFIGKKSDIKESLLMSSQQQLYIDEDSIQKGAGPILTRALNRVLIKDFSGVFLSPDDVRAVYDKTMLENPDDSVLSLTRQAGIELGADYIIFGNVWRFKNRTGNALASTSPSAVSFSLHLIDVANGTRVWKGTYEKSQQSLTENVFKASDFFKQGARWLTAEELATFGMKYILKNSPLKKR